MIVRAFSSSDYLDAGRCSRRIWERFHVSDGAQAVSEKPGKETAGDSGSQELSNRFQRVQYEQVRSVALNRYHNRPGFQTDVEVAAYGFVVRVDVLAKRPDGSVCPYLIQPAANIKPHALDLLRLQRFLLNDAGYNAHGGVVVCLSKRFEREKELDIEGLFVERDCSKQLRGATKQVRNRIASLHAIAEQVHAPDRCSRINGCPACLAGELAVTEKTGFDIGLHTLFRGGGIVGELRREGYSRIDQIPQSRLPGRRQKLQVEAVRQNERHVDLVKLTDFLARIRYPRVFLDFETVSQAVPPVSGVRPWEHVPFQFSVHRQESEHEPIRHIDFLAEDLHELCDPRPQLAEALARALEGIGSLLVFSAAFERRILLRLAEWVPEYESRFRDAVDRIVDIQQPFVDFHVYEPLQAGKTGLKSVLPAITGEGYDHLDVADGLEASLRWFFEYRRSAQCPDSLDVPARDRMAERLKAYCGLDTEALVRILKELELIADYPDHP